MNTTMERQGSRIKRTDVRTCDLINQAIASIPSVGLQRAAEFLNSMNVPAEIAIRTLVYPGRRRT
jgi:ribosomal protein S13